MKLQLKGGRYYYLLKHPDRRGYRWIGLSHDPQERTRQREALDAGVSVEEVLGEQAPGAWIGAHVDLLLKRVRERARGADIYCDLSADEIRGIGNEQRWRCALTGILFSLDRTDGVRSRPFAPSIDRIRNDEGYTRRNCRLVCVAMNLAMNEYGELVFRRLAIAYCRRKKLLQQRGNLEDRQSLEGSLLNAGKEALKQ